MPTPSRSSRLIVLVAVVALAVLASAAIGAASRPHVVDASLSVPDLSGIAAVALLVLAVAVGVAIGRNFIAGWAHEPEYQDLNRKKSKVPRVVRVLAPILLLFVVMVVRMWSLRETETANRAPIAEPIALPIVPAAADRADLTLLIVCVVLVVAAAILAAIPLRRRVSLTTPATAAPESVGVILDEGLDALLAEADPRRAVIAAYVAMERAMARQGWARRPAEAPTEFLGRVLGVAPERAPDLTRLVGLYQIARFSEHAVTSDMREEAIESVKRLRDDLELRGRWGRKPAEASVPA